jgi:glutamate-1-semialdehyde 2,1-aminomutase
MSVDRTAVAALIARERDRFAAAHRRSAELWEQGKAHWLYGAPSHWMRRWIGGWPVYAVDNDGGYGARLRDADGHRYADFCLGDTGGMCGHGHPAIARAIAAQAALCTSTMLPTGDANRVAAELARRFRLPYWNLTTSASDANRACIRLARMVTGRPRVLVFSGCYHGSIEEAHVELVDGEVRLRNGIHDNAFPHERLTRVVEFNDVAALRDALQVGDVACVLAEPAMTNYGMVEPLPGFHEALRALTREAGTLLILDETHTISSGAGGYTRRHDLSPDMLVLGKAIAGGVPAGAFGLSAQAAARVWAGLPPVSPWARQSAHAGFGGTLAGNALTVAAMRAVLEEVLTEDAFARMETLAQRLQQALRGAFERACLAWHVARIGARVEVLLAPQAPRDASDVRRARDGEIEGLIHLYLMNRGVLITPFHTMMLTCPGTTEGDVGECVAAFEALAMELCR